MAIRVSGLVSGLDTDSIVQELVSAYSVKKDKYVKAQTKLEWKMDAWKELNTKVNSLYKRLSNMKYTSYYAKKTTSISDSTKATVSAGNNALNGTQTLSIDQVATTGYITGGKLAKGTTADSTLKSLGMADGTGSIAVAVGGETTNIEISSDMTVSQFVEKLKEAGVSANYDAANNRLFVSAKESGKDNDFALTATDANGLSALKSAGLYVASNANNEAYAAWEKYAYDASGNRLSDDEIKANFKDILDTIAKYQGDSSESESIAKLEEDNADLKTKITNLQADRNYAVAYMSVKDALAIEDENPDGTKTARLTDAEQEEMANLLRRTDAELEEVNKKDRFNELKTKLGYSEEDFNQLRTNARAMEEYEKDSTNAAVVTEVKDAYANDTMQDWVDNNTAEITAASDQMKANAEKIAEKQAFIADHALLTNAAPANDVLTNDDRAMALLEKLQFVESAKNDTSYSQGATRINGTNAIITLNNATFESDSNEITVNGITITAMQVTAPGEKLTITTQTNAQGIYDSIKDFFKEYNALIKEMDELYNADSAKGYEPLTDDEKDAMSDKEIEKWEEKIKDSLLRRDDTLSSVMSLMTSAMSQSFTLSDGKKYSLASFGIKTQGYLSAAANEGYCYHIDGDSEDEVSSGNNNGTNALLSAIQADPDKVEEFFKNLTSDLYDKLDKKMRSSTLNSKFSIYHDKQLQKEYDEYDDMIEKWEDKVSSMEEYYYNKFAAMEKALSTLQQSTSALSGLLGS